MTRFRLPISLAVSVVILLSAAAAYAYPSLDTKASYVVGYQGKLSNFK